MSSELRCSLCSGKLTKEKNVIIALGAITYAQAWVCTYCSAAFPMAVWQKKAFGALEPLYTEGKRLADKSS